ncbi:3-phosphoshikimate 1-carboxyvinyltransferase [Bacillus sp. RG28]|uniref:3-phosphoshikimate 1-carboxyvinyltransferase n=1 Tax=Gottfriedia endophytica TaxID=2820819 RepID=A0A940SJ18_9BACI|nr:3-phosphoshikimate 1-carboxyvinyltransferase [Gottfriedia endophytica]MBP0723768.1 3-phosphoshikimate 1-carboxyvinyltransferase [Gottfriedia endophytica]
MKLSEEKKKSVKLEGRINIPGDKSISHRSVMFGSMATGTTKITNFLAGEDCLSTISCFRELGVSIKQEGSSVEIQGNGLSKLNEPTRVLDVGNSGTTIRLMLGILAGLPFHVSLQGDDSIAKRPMKRVTGPLSQMGAKIDGRQNGTYCPLSIRGGNLEAMDYQSPVASAQVKSAILLAGLQANGTTSVTEPSKSRDHTERMLQAFGVYVIEEGNKVSITGGQTLKATTIEVPGDISSAAFFLVAGAITPNSRIVLKNVGINQTRTGIIDILVKMGALISIQNERVQSFERVADLIIETSDLKGTIISGDVIPRAIDEIPIIALAATQATGTTIIKDAQELKVKETNRIDTVVNELRKLGANIEPTDDGMIIHGKTSLHGGEVDSHGDHRIGMMLAIANLITDSEVSLKRKEAINVSYPTFFEDLQSLCK